MELTILAIECDKFIKAIYFFRKELLKEDNEGCYTSTKCLLALSYYNEKLTLEVCGKKFIYDFSPFSL